MGFGPLCKKEKEQCTSISLHLKILKYNKIDKYLYINRAKLFYT